MTGQVFISHTSDVERFPAGRSFAQAALDAVNRAGMTPVDMRYFAAREGKAADYCRQRVGECDAYIAVVGFRYGSLVPGETVSYTELEFDAATEAGLHRLAFLLDEEASGLPPEAADADRGAVEGFRQRLRDAGLVVRSFATADRLELEVFHALSELASSESPAAMAGPSAPPFGARLRQLRTDSGMTQEELARAAGVSARSVRDLERGKTATARKDTARLLADALGLAGPAREAFETAARGHRPVGELAGGWLVPFALAGVLVLAGGAVLAGRALFSPSSSRPGSGPTTPLGPAGTTTASSTPAPTSTVKPSSITVGCSLSRKNLKPGMTLQLTYHISVSSAVLAGLGVGLYDNQGHDHSNGRYDRNAFPLMAGSHSYTRLVAIRANLAPGRYEMDAEIWPPHHVGQNGFNTWADHRCAYMTVPRL